MKHKPIATRDQAQTVGADLIWLLGQPHLGDYLEFVATKVVGGRKIDPRLLAEEWRVANDLYYELEQSEAGVADTVEYLPLNPSLEPLADAVRANPWFRDSFDNLPVSFARVELDKLVVSQNHVERGFTDALGAALGAEPDDASLFRFCLPLERPSRRCVYSG